MPFLNYFPFSKIPVGIQRTRCLIILNCIFSKCIEISYAPCSINNRRIGHIFLHCTADCWLLQVAADISPGHNEVSQQIRTCLKCQENLTLTHLPHLRMQVLKTHTQDISLRNMATKSWISPSWKHGKSLENDDSKKRIIRNCMYTFFFQKAQAPSK